MRPFVFDRHSRESGNPEGSRNSSGLDSGLRRNDGGEKIRPFRNGTHICVPYRAPAACSFRSFFLLRSVLASSTRPRASRATP